MKKLRFFVTMVLFLMAFAISVSAAPGLVWDLTDPDTATLWDIVSPDNTLSFSEEENCLLATVTGVDPLFARNLTPEQQFSAKDYPVIRIRMKIVDGVAGNFSIFWTTEKMSWSLEQLQDVTIDYQDNVWFDKIVDLSEKATWCDTITGLRIDPLGTGYGGEMVYVQYVALFPSVAEAEAFDFDKYLNPEEDVPSNPDTPSDDVEQPNSPETGDVGMLVGILPALATSVAVVVIKRKKTNN